MTTQYTDTNFVGTTIGSSAAHAEHFVRVAANFVVRETGRTGRGIAVGYATTAAVRAHERNTKAALRAAAQAAPAPIGVVITA